MMNLKCTFRATPLPNEQEDDLQEDVCDERNVMNTLLQCSELEDQLLQIINCQEWTEAVNGWKPTVPNPTYITHSSTPQQEEKSNKRNDKEGRKEKQTHRKHHYQESWRSKIEPGTYRYNPRYNPEHTWQFHGSNTRRYTNIQKRATDPQLLEHIERVREHLEKTLVKKNSDQVISDVIKEGKKEFNKNCIHNFMSHLTEHNQRKSEQLHVRLSQSLTDLKGSSSNDKPLFLRNSPSKTNLQQDTEPCHSNSVNPAGDHNSNLADSHLPFVTVISKKPHNSLIMTSDEVGDNNGVNPASSISQEDKDNTNIRRLKKPERHSTSAGKLSSNNLCSRSFEKFPAYTIPHQDLNPLTKLTPTMRKVSDDNEIIMVHLNGSCSDASPSSAPISMSTQARERTPVRKESPQQYLTRVDAPNKNFIHTGINGKSVSPANQHKLKIKSNRLITKDTCIKPRKTPTTPHRLASLGKPSEYATNPLDSLHRGAFERDTATAIASEILPGISGRKVGVPVLSHRVL